MKTIIVDNVSLNSSSILIREKIANNGNLLLPTLSYEYHLDASVLNSHSSLALSYIWVAWRWSFLFKYHIFFHFNIHIQSQIMYEPIEYKSVCFLLMLLSWIAFQALSTSFSYVWSGNWFDTLSLRKPRQRQVPPAPSTVQPRRKR